MAKSDLSKHKAVAVLGWLTFSYGTLIAAHLAGASVGNFPMFFFYFGLLAFLAGLVKDEESGSIAYWITTWAWILILATRLPWGMVGEASPIPFVGDVSYGLLLVVLYEPAWKSPVHDRNSRR